MGQKLQKTWELKLQKKSRNKKLKYPGTKVEKIWETKFQKSRNKSYKKFKNMGTKIPKI
jgi:hypothetical protein